MMSGWWVWQFTGWSLYMSIKSPIFIVGRFRSGTSFLWQIFNQLQGYCAWYEPLHPELLTAIKHIPPKDDHVGITDYWQSYRDNPSFADFYAVEFATRQLYLEPQDDFPALLNYLKHLMALSGDQRPVLQLNRADLRLSWLRHYFPQATIIHIERNPLQLYYSQRKHIDKPQRDDLQHWDAYELLPWCWSLSTQFPMLLDAKHDHAFYGFYWLYRMSQILGRRLSDISIQLEADVFESDDYLDKLKQVIDLKPQQITTIKAIKHVPDTPVFNSQEVEHLSAIMTATELDMSATGLLEHLGKHNLETIQFSHQDFWGPLRSQTPDLKSLTTKCEETEREVKRIADENLGMTEQLANHAVDLTAASIELQQHMTRDLSPSQQQKHSSELGQLLLKINVARNQMATELANHRKLKSQLDQASRS